MAGVGLGSQPFHSVSRHLRISVGGVPDLILLVGRCHDRHGLNARLDIVDVEFLAGRPTRPAAWPS